LGHYACRTDLQRLLEPRIIYDQHSYSPVKNEVVYQGGTRTLNYWDAEIRDHFGINGVQALYLFGPQGCGGARTPKQAARYIERFVRDQRA
jgi:hypothetical protein